MGAQMVRVTLQHCSSVVNFWRMCLPMQWPAAAQLMLLVSSTKTTARGACSVTCLEVSTEIMPTLILPWLSS
jgi:hypothetical protein